MTKFGKLINFAKRHFVLLAVLFVILITLMSYLAYSAVYWRNLKANNDKMTTAMNESLVGLQASNLTPDNFNAIYQKTASIKKCSTNKFVAWQEDIVGGKEEVSACERNNAMLDKQIKVLNEVATTLESDNKIAEIITKINSDLTAVSDNKYDNYANLWSSAAKSLRDLNYDLANSIAGKADEIATAYQELKAADEKQDRAAYDEKLRKIDELYAAVTAYQVQANDNFESKASQIIEAYKISE